MADIGIKELKKETAYFNIQLLTYTGVLSKDLFAIENGV